MNGAGSNSTSRTSCAVRLSLPSRVACMRSRKSSSWSSLYPRLPNGARSNVTQSTTAGVKGTTSKAQLVPCVEEVLRRFQALAHQRLRRIGTVVDVDRQLLAFGRREVPQHEVCG